MLSSNRILGFPCVFIKWPINKKGTRVIKIIYLVSPTILVPGGTGIPTIQAFHAVGKFFLVGIIHVHPMDAVGQFLGANRRDGMRQFHVVPTVQPRKHGQDLVVDPSSPLLAGNVIFNAVHRAGYRVS